MRKTAQTTSSIRQPPKSPNIPAGDQLPAISGNTKVIAAAKVQWTNMAEDCPCARSAVGKSSETNTHITTPCPAA